MIKVKTSELIGPQLDWAVAKAYGLHPLSPDGNSWAKCVVAAYPDEPIAGQFRYIFDPSTNWRQGGPIMDELKPEVVPCHADFQYVGQPYIGDFYKVRGRRKEWSEGKTLLIAGMRAWVAFKLGDEVEVPELP